MKILYVTTISLTMGFFSEHIRMLQDAGHKVELACNLDESLAEKVKLLNCVEHHIPFSRSPLSKDNIKAYGELKELLDRERYDIVHTHTPNASVIVRLACRGLRKKGLKVFYTAHGFHFYKGAPLKNWLLYFPVEWMLSRVTDALITINKEDYARAQKFGAKKVCYVPGVGIDFSKFDFEFSKEERRAKRAELGVPENAKLLVSVGELNRNKNHEMIVRALSKLNDSNVHYCIVGSGDLREYLESLAKELGVAEQVHLLGYRNDVAQIYKVSDVFCFASFREGLPVALMEAMESELCVICSPIRGNTDLISDNVNGFVAENNADIISEKILAAVRCVDTDYGYEMRRRAKKTVREFGVERVLEKLKSVYGLNAAE